MEDEVLAMVVRNGLHTTMGNMIRQLIAPSYLHKEKHPLQKVIIASAFGFVDSASQFHMANFTYGQVKW